jgi:malonyl-CoA/methylmalonyl-CoA synthetase
VNLAAHILDLFATDPAPAALTLLDESGQATKSYTRGELLERAGAWSTRLRMADATPGVSVALALQRDIDLAAVHLAALAAAAPIVPINTGLADRELRNLLDASRPSVVIADPAFAEAHSDAARSSGSRWWLTGPSPIVDEETFAMPDLSQPGALTACPSKDDAAALILFTSGTTGQAKSVPLSHGNLRCNLQALQTQWARTSSNRLLHMLPAHHFHGLVLALYGSLLCGNEIFLMPRFDARTALDAIKGQRCDLIMGVPTMYARMAEAAQPEDDLSSVSLALSGSAPLAPKTWSAFHQTFGVRLVERYGLTETCIVSTNPPSDPRPGSVGRALPETDVSFHDEGNYRSDLGARGEICVRSPSVTAGYGNDSEANAQSFHEGWFHTGDLGHIDEDGYIWIDGRIKELIIVGGSNVVPGEVERALDNVDGVRELAVCGVPDEDLGEVVAAFVVSLAGDSEALERDLRAASESELAGYKRPRRYVFLDALPRNAMGKIDRRALSDAGS